MTKDKSDNKPSVLLKDLIDLVNLVPPKAVFPTIDELKSDIGLKTWDGGNSHDEAEHFKNLFALSERIRGIVSPYPVLKYLLENPAQSDFFHQNSSPVIHPQYREFLAYRSLLRRVAEGAMNFFSLGYMNLIEFQGESSPAFESDFVAFELDQLPAGLYTLSIINGKFSFSISPFIESLQSQEAVRLGICPTCDKIFWKYRLNAAACSKQCSNAYRQKRWYSKPDNKEVFLRNKKAKYHQGKENDRFPSRLKKESE